MCSETLRKERFTINMEKRESGRKKPVVTLTSRDSTTWMTSLNSSSVAAEDHLEEVVEDSTSIWVVVIMVTMASISKRSNLRTCSKTLMLSH